MDPASLALSVLPLAFGALKTYRIVADHLAIFKGYSREVQAIYRKLRVQECAFGSELSIIIQRAARQCGYPPCSSDELSDFNNPTWRDKTVDGALKGFLGPNEEAFRYLLSRIAEQLQGLQADLGCFNVLYQQKAAGELIEQAVRRLRARVRITFEKKRLEERLTALREDNAELRVIGSYSDDPRSANVVGRLPQSVYNTRMLCSALYDALQKRWTCSDPKHAAHIARLGLESIHQERSSQTCLSLAITWSEHSAPATQTPGSAVSACNAPLWTLVRTSHGSTSGGQRGQNNDLAQQASLCQSLTRCSCPPDERCLGYLEADGNAYQLQLFSQKCHCTGQVVATEAEALTEWVRPGGPKFTLLQRLLLARVLVLTVLQLCSTPWLQEHWRLTDIASFASHSDDADAILKQLHITSRALEPSAATPSGPSPRLQEFLRASHPADDTRTVADNLSLLGVNNLLLFSLGVALLEVAHWQPLEDFQRSRDPNLVFTARRLAQSACDFGPAYQRVAQQCLQCDFGRGSRMDEHDLEAAVYHTAVGRLDAMIKALTGD